MLSPWPAYRAVIRVHAARIRFHVASPAGRITIRDHIIDALGGRKFGIGVMPPDQQVGRAPHTDVLDHG
jgi:hypothetical protein